jgi:hypothetical protein
VTAGSSIVPVAAAAWEIEIRRRNRHEHDCSGKPTQAMMRQTLHTEYLIGIGHAYKAIPAAGRALAHSKRTARILMPSWTNVSNTSVLRFDNQRAYLVLTEGDIP